MNEPRVDWIRIIWKCQSRFKMYSKADWFAREQCFNFAIQQMINAQNLRRVAQNGHKKPLNVDTDNIVNRIIRDVRRKQRRLENENKIWFGQPDLNCDDPLYDGNHIF